MEATFDTPTLARGSSAARWSGRVLTGIPVAFMLFDATIKFAHIPEVAEASLQLGWPTHLNPVLGLVILGCLALYLWPRTAALGATLLHRLPGRRGGDPSPGRRPPRHATSSSPCTSARCSGLDSRCEMRRVRALILPK